MPWLNGLPLMANVVSWLLSSLHLVASSLAVKSNIYKVLNGLSLMMKALSRLLRHPDDKWNVQVVQWPPHASCVSHERLRAKQSKDSR